MVVITGLDKVQVEIQVMRVLYDAGPNILNLRAVLADPASDDLFLGIGFANGHGLLFSI